MLDAAIREGVLDQSADVVNVEVLLAHVTTVTCAIDIKSALRALGYCTFATVSAVVDGA